MQWIALLAEPVTLIGAALLVLCWLLRRAPWLGPLGLAVGTTVVYFWVASPLGANLAVGALENGFSVPDGCAAATPGSVIVVLAGGLSGSPATPEEYSRLHESTLRRTLEGVRLAARTRDSRLVLAGGSGDQVREADLMGSLARALGFPSARMSLERASQTTHESAEALAVLLRTEAGTRQTVLVTSALHMPRALASFRRAGLPVCPYPVDYRQAESRLHEMLIPQLSALSKGVQAYHEIVGLLVYRITGKI